VDGSDVGNLGFVADALDRALPGWFIRDPAPQILQVTAHANTEQITVQRHPPTLFMTRYSGVLHEDSLAKYAVAFFKMSRSILSRAFSARRGAKLHLLWADWLVASALDFAAALKTGPILECLLWHTEYLRVDQSHLGTPNSLTDYVSNSSKYLAPNFKSFIAFAHI